MSKIPRFTAEQSLYRTRKPFNSLGSGRSYRSDAGIVPQFCVPFGNGIYCDPEPTTNLPGVFPREPFDHTYAQCRAGCYHSNLKGAALRSCLAEC